MQTLARALARSSSSSPYRSSRFFASAGFSNSFSGFSSCRNMSTIKINAGKESDYQDGTMKEIEAGEAGKVLVSKVGGKIYATGAKCTHYGAPLAKGVLSSDGRLVCPWHGACFRVQTGDIEDAPGLAPLPSFRVSTSSSGEITIEADPAEVKKSFAPRSCRTKAAQGEKGVVIVGGGPGAAFAATALRETGYSKPITILSASQALPIDRTKISKALIDDPKKLQLHSEKELKDVQVDIKLGARVNAIDAKSKTVTTESGEKVSYDELILAVGSVARSLPLDGANLKNVFTLRDIPDAKQINEAVGPAPGEDDPEPKEKKPVVVVGSSWIGMEVAVSLSKRKDLSVTVIGMEKVPFEKILGPQVGGAIQKLHEKNGVKFYLSASLEKFVGSTKIESVQLKSGEKIPAEVVILGVGVKPATESLSGLSDFAEIGKDGGIAVDEFLRVKGAENVWAIGDIARWKDLKTGKDVRIEHWNVAGNHGRAAAFNIAAGQKGEKLQAFDKIPVFWSAQGSQLRYCGTPESSEWEDVYIKGNVDELKFAAFYSKGDKVVAIATMGMDPIVSQSTELLRLDLMPSIKAIRDGKDVLTIALKP